MIRQASPFPPIPDEIKKRLDELYDSGGVYGEVMGSLTPSPRSYGERVG